MEKRRKSENNTKISNNNYTVPKKNTLNKARGVFQNSDNKMPVQAPSLNKTSGVNDKNENKYKHINNENRVSKKYPNPKSLNNGQEHLNNKDEKTEQAHFSGDEQNDDNQNYTGDSEISRRNKDSNNDNNKSSSGNNIQNKDNYNLFSKKEKTNKSDVLGKEGGKIPNKGLEKSAQDGAKAASEGTKAASEGAKAANEGTKATIAGAKGTAAVGKGVGAAVSGGCLSTIVPFIALLMATVIILSSVLSILCGDTMVETETLSNEAQEILYIFNSFVYTSDDDEKAQYQEKLEKIKNNGYASILCAEWKGLVVDYYFTPISETDFYVEQYDKEMFDSPYECVFSDYCARYYLEEKDNIYLQKNFDNCGYEKDKYLNIAPHYHYLNNILKMCIDSFVDPNTNKIYEKAKISLYEEKSTDKTQNTEKTTDEKAAKEDKEDKEEKTQKTKIKKIIKNLEGKDGLANKCITYEGEKDGKRYKVPFIKLLHDDKGFLYNKKDLTFKKGIINSIINYEYMLTMGGDSTDICELAKGEIGKKGTDYCNGQTKAYGNGGVTAWCAIFQAYLLEQTGISPAEVGWSASCSQWIANATAKGLYHSRESGYKPQPGDILFFSWGHVGIIYGVNGTKLITIEGNTDSNDNNTSVVGQHDNYTTNSTDIKGYISMSTFYASISGSGEVKAKIVDSTYIGHKVKINNAERKKIEALVTNENGVNKYTGCLLLAQCMRDAIYSGRAKAATVKKDMGYTASDSGTPCQDAKKAVKKIFDEGGYAVKHRILYMYNPFICKSAWHESQLFVCEHGEGKNKIRYFDAKN